MDYLELIFILAAVMSLPLILMYRSISRYLLSHGSSDSEGPIIGSGSLLSSGNLSSMNKGVIEGFTYNAIVGSNGRLIVFIELHHNTNVHLVAVGAKSGLMLFEQGIGLTRHLKKIELEGNFSQSFSMYCRPGNENELLQVFDPADMAYFVDFCRAYDFELYKDSIYITKAEKAKDKEDTTPLMADVEAFLKRNHRMLKRLGAT